MQQIAYTIEQAALVTALTAVIITTAIRDGELLAREVAGHPFVAHKDLKKWTNTRPAWKP